MTNADPSDLVIRDIDNISEMREVERLQSEVWGVADLEVFPALALIPIIELGGVLVGAFDKDRMAGFVFGFPGQEKGKTILHSDMLAVRPEYRRHGLGYTLKLAQRGRALAKGINTITWTFDPLQARNARLNFGKLGVISDSYRVNYYGETTSFLHRSGTDRLWVTWELDSERVARRIEGNDLENSETSEPDVALRVDENREPNICDIELKGKTSLAIEIPEDINELTGRDVEITSRWRAATREVFTKLMDAGFRVTEFQFVTDARGRAGRYLLIKESAN
ncbi:MAG TPA: GNAT family N-acetyltransferase [Pyrinomonadaceae bacterium]|nr:GNAT family N-acetyltransferase [Pyrinomonadaceae bacterium]